MLVQKTPSNGDVVTLKLISGEEVVARLKDMTMDSLEVSKPLSVGLSPNGQVGMVPFMVGLNDDAVVTFDRNHILVISAARKEMSDAYTASTSNIVPASAGTGGHGGIPGGGITMER